MLRATSKKGKTKSPKVFPGICLDARTLGVDRTHLWRVLIGQRSSSRLLAKYRALNTNQA